MGRFDEAAERLYGDQPAEPDELEPGVDRPPEDAPPETGRFDAAAESLYGGAGDPFSQAGRRKQADRFNSWKTANEQVSPERATEVFYLSQATGKAPEVVDATFDELKAQIKQGEIETQTAGVDELQKLLADASTRPMVQDDVANLRGLWGTYQRAHAKMVTKGVELIPLMLSAGAEAVDKGPEANAMIAAAVLGRGEEGEANQKSLIEGMRLWWRYTNRELSPWGEEQAEELEAAGMPSYFAKGLGFAASLPGGQMLVEQEGEPTDEEFLRQATMWVGRASKRGKEEGAGANLMIAEELERHTKREFGEESLAESMLTAAPAGAMELFWDHSVQAAGAWVFGSLGAAGGGSAGAAAGGAPAAPGAAVGGLAGALGTGMAWDTAQAGPQLYLAFRSMRNPDGTRMHTDDEARQFAWLTAAGSGVVTGIPGVKILEKMPILGGMIDRWKKRSVKTLAKKALGEVGEEIIEAPGTQRALLEHLIEQDLTADMARKKTAEWMSREGVKQVTKDGLKQIGSIGTWTALNYAGQGAAHATGIEVSKATKGYEFKASNILDQALNTMGQGLHDTMLVMSLGPGRASISRMMNISESRAMGEHLTDIIARAEESKLRKLAPVVFEQFAKETAERAGADAIYVDLEVFNAGLEKLGENPAEFAAAVMGDDGVSYRQAVRTGGKVQMPFSTYTARILDTEADADLRSGMTLDERHASSAEMDRLRALGDKVATADQTKQAEFVGQVRQAIIDQALATESNLSLSEIETSADLFAEQIRTALEAHSVSQQEGIIEQIGGLVDALNLHGPTSQAVTEHLVKKRLQKQAEALARVNRAEAKEWTRAQEKMGLANALELAAIRQKAGRLQTERAEARAAGKDEEVGRINVELSAIDEQHRKLAGLGVAEAPAVEVEQVEVGDLPETAAGRIRKTELEQADLGPPIIFPDEGGAVVLSQNEDTPRGQLTYTGATGEQRTFDLMLFARADVSTLTHELFHFFGEIMAELASNPDAPQTIVENYDQLAKFMGYESGEARSAEKVTEFEERGSYAWEQYLAEGKPPTSALAPAFHAMKRWMLGIWRNFVSRGEPRAVAGVKTAYKTAFGQEIGLTDEVRNLFDRLLAGEDAAKKAAEEAGLIFDPVLAEMMDEAERAQHEQEATEALGEAQDQLASQVQLDLAAKGLEDSRTRITEEVKEELDQNPAYRAEHFLKTGLHLEDVRRRFSEMTLTNERGEAYGISRAVTLRALQDTFATGVTRKEQKEAKRKATAFLGELPTGIFSDLRSVEDAAQGDALAQTQGYANLRDMLTAIKDAEPRASKESRLIQERLAEEFGDIVTNPEGYAERAAAAVENPKALKFLLHQLNTIRKKLGYDVEVINTLENQAKRLIDEMPLSALSPARFRNQEAQAAARALRETEAGNWDAANAAKTEQILNALLARKAAATKKKTDAAEKKVKQATRDPWRTALGRADPEQGRFVDPNDAILQAVGIMPPPAEGEDVPLFSPLRDVVAEGGSFTEADGSLAFDDALIEQIIQQQKPWKSLTTTEALEVRDAIRNIRALANDRRSIDVEGKARDLDSAALELETAIRKNLKRKAKLARSEDLKTLREKIGQGFEYMGALFRGMEFVIDAIDGDDIDGPGHRYMWDGFISSRNAEDAIAEKYMKPWALLMIKQKKKKGDRLKDPANTKDADGRELLPMTEDEGDARDGSLSRRQLMMVLFNMGNGTQEIGEDGELRWATGNIQRLLDGRGWKYDDVIQAIEQNLSEEEVMLVQKGWAALEGLAPMVNERHKQAEGLPMGMVKARPLALTIDGKKIELTGGYFPAAYSPAFSATGKAQQAEIAAPGKGRGGAKARVQKNFTKRRAEKVSQMISLKFDVITRAFEDHIHYIAFSKWVVDMQKILEHPRIEKAMREHLGEKQTPFLSEFVKAVAGNNSYAADVTDMDAMSAMGFFRGVFSSIVLGLSAPVALGDEASVLGSIMDFDDLFSDVSPGMRVKYIAQAHRALLGRKYVIDPETGEQTEPSTLAREIGFSPAMEEAQKKSKELRYRANRNATRYSEALKRMGITSELGAYFDFMYVLLEQSDMRASAVIWTAAYNMAVDQGHDPGGEAIKRADKLTRRVQPKIGPELSPVMRKKYLSVLFAFFGFMNNHGNRLELMARRGARKARDPSLTGKQKRKAAAVAAGSMAAGYLVEIMIGDWFSGHGPDDDDDWDWGLISGAAASTRYVPIVGDVGEALTKKALGKKGPQIRQRQAPNLALAEMLKIQASKILGAWTDGKLDEKDATVAITALFSMLPRRPQGSAKFAGHLFGKATGIKGLETKAKIRTVGGVPNPGDVLHGLLYGAPYSGRFAHQSPFATVGTTIDAIAGDTP